MSCCSLPIATSATRARARRRIGGPTRRTCSAAETSSRTAPGSRSIARAGSPRSRTFATARAAAPLSRGALVADYLRGAQPLDEFAAALGARRNDYGPFSLLLRERGALRIVSNRAPPAELGAGVQAISNAAYGVEWPKVRSAREGMRRALEAPDPVAELFALLAERSGGATPEERYMTSHFVEGPVYGTRSSTVIAIGRDGQLTFAERSFDASARITNEVRTSFALGPLASRSTAEPV